MFGSIVAGATVVLAERFSPATFWSEASSYRATVAYALFAAAILYLMPPRPEDADNTLKKFLCIPLISEINDFARRFGVEGVDRLRAQRGRLGLHVQGAGAAKGYQADGQDQG